MKNKICRGYINQLKKAIPNSIKNKERFIYSVSLDIDNFLDENPNAVDTDVYSEFGSPEALANSLVDDWDYNQINALHLNQKRMKHVIALLSCSVVIVLLFVFIIVPHIAVKVNQEVYIYDEIEGEGDK